MKWLNSLLRRLNSVLTFNSRQGHLLCGDVFRIRSSLLGFIDDDSLKLLFFVKKV